MDFKAYNKNKNGKTITCAKDFLICCYKIVDNEDFSCYVDGHRKSSSYINIKSGDEWYRFWDKGAPLYIRSVICGGKYGSFHNEKGVFYNLIQEVLGIKMQSDVSLYQRALRQELTDKDVAEILNDCNDPNLVMSVVYFTEEEVEFRYNEDKNCVSMKVGCEFIDTILGVDDVYELCCIRGFNISHELDELHDDYLKKESINNTYVSNYSSAICSIIDIIDKNEDITIKKFNKIVRKYMVGDRKKYVEIRSPKSSKTYLMIDKLNNMYKIGKSVNPKVRERTLQSEKPSIEMLYTIDRDVESVLHNYFSHKRVRGEWFRLLDNDLDYIIENYNAVSAN